MKIGIDARLYGTKHGGIGRYTQELIRNLLAIDPAERDYVFFVYSKEDKEHIRADIGEGARPRVRFILVPYRCYTVPEQLFMPFSIAHAKVDLMHFTHFNVPLVYHAPFIVTIHDLIIHHFPDERATTLPRWFYKIKLIGYKKVMRHAVLKARAIIAPSEATKKDILRFYRVEEKKIRVIYEGVASLKSQFPNSNFQSNPNFQIPISKSYLLYVGSFYPHKNIERLIDAFYILRAKYNLDIKLVLVGKKDYFQKQLQMHIENNGAMEQWSNGIIFYGYAPDAELAELYQNATLFIFPSLYEGFGLPPLEAMQFGVPVVASRASCLQEVLGDAALYCEPQSGEDIAEKIAALYTNHTLQEQLRQKGYEQLKKYSWQKMAQQTEEIYQNEYDRLI